MISGDARARIGVWPGWVISPFKAFSFQNFLWRDAHLARSKLTTENFSAARSESDELSKDGHRPLRVSWLNTAVASNPGLAAYLITNFSTLVARACYQNTD